MLAPHTSLALAFREPPDLFTCERIHTLTQMQNTPSASYSLTLRVKLASRTGTLGELTTAIGRAGGDIGAIDIVNVGPDAVVRDLGGQSFSIAAHDKALYHAAAVMSSGHVVALSDLAIEMLVACGLNPRRARAVLLPLLHSTIENLSAHEPAGALTGTFARADVATVRRHLQALHEQGSREALAAYTLLGQRSLQLAKSNGADETILKEIALMMKQAVKKR